MGSSLPERSSRRGGFSLHFADGRPGRLPSASGFFGATGRVELAAPLVCPASPLRARVETVTAEDGDGVVTNYYLDCVDADHRAHRVPTFTLLVALYSLMAAPGLALALAFALAHRPARSRRRAP